MQKARAKKNKKGAKAAGLRSTRGSVHPSWPVAVVGHPSLLHSNSRTCALFHELGVVNKPKKKKGTRLRVSFFVFTTGRLVFSKMENGFEPEPRQLSAL